MSFLWIELFGLNVFDRTQQYAFSLCDVEQYYGNVVHKHRHQISEKTYADDLCNTVSYSSGWCIGEFRSDYRDKSFKSRPGGDLFRETRHLSRLTVVHVKKKPCGKRLPCARTIRRKDDERPEGEILREKKIPAVNWSGWGEASYSV